MVVSLVVLGYYSCQNIERLYIAGTGGGPADRDPFGSHPDLDPNWSTEILEFVHEMEANKIEKCQLIGQYEVALQTLHVCLQFPGTGIKLWECEKCLRSQVYLQASWCSRALHGISNASGSKI